MNDKTEQTDQRVTDSRTVAKHFKKRHDNVLRAVQRVECSAEILAPQF